MQFMCQSKGKSNSQLSWDLVLDYQHEWNKEINRYTDNDVNTALYGGVKALVKENILSYQPDFPTLSPLCGNNVWQHGFYILDSP